MTQGKRVYDAALLARSSYDLSIAVHHVELVRLSANPRRAAQVQKRFRRIGLPRSDQSGWKLDARRIQFLGDRTAPWKTLPRSIEYTRRYPASFKFIPPDGGRPKRTLGAPPPDKQEKSARPQPLCSDCRETLRQAKHSMCRLFILFVESCLARNSYRTRPISASNPRLPKETEGQSRVCRG